MSIITKPDLERPNDNQISCDVNIDGKSTKFIIERDFLNILECGQLIEIDSVEYKIESIKYNTYSVSHRAVKGDSKINRFGLVLVCSNL